MRQPCEKLGQKNEPETVLGFGYFTFSFSADVNIIVLRFKFCFCLAFVLSNIQTR